MRGLASSWLPTSLAFPGVRLSVTGKWALVLFSRWLSCWPPDLGLTGLQHAAQTSQGAVRISQLLVMALPA